jgi:hypothetical protein
MARSLADKSNNDRFRLRLTTVMKKADELRSYDAEIYVLVRRRGRYHEYSSADITEWPPTRPQVVILPCSDHGIGLTVIEAQSYPLPVRKSPGDFQKHTETHRKLFEADGHSGYVGSFTPDSSSSTDTIIHADNAIYEDT